MLNIFWKRKRKITVGYVIHSVLIFIFALWVAYVSSQYIPPTGFIGVKLGKNDALKCIQVIEIEENMPAERAGIQVNDCISYVNDKNVEKDSVSHVKSLLNGNPGMYVKVKVKRQGDYYEYSIKRVNRTVRYLPFNVEWLVRLIIY